MAAAPSRNLPTLHLITSSFLKEKWFQLTFCCQVLACPIILYFILIHSSYSLNKNKDTIHLLLSISASSPCAHQRTSPT
ncbi:hypothetical protein VIGAN_01200300 [Vigna angularis var. angularis]|uniref:Uncharacterized protein n=1 Tax=Vigna angularis var. angularis TaxID=157739 RepID=A0A0S3R1I8_PHAAN|nr:hypothetical protein VIGAN_01200300 [Vigna angularis var. angularis]